jgi:calcineurin-like phosphoesterase family protein
MDEEMVRLWNAKVPVGATVYHLGDVSFHKKDRLKELLARLNGNIRLLFGNHDRKLRTWKGVLERFEWVKDYHESETDDGRKVVMCHYPLASWNKAHYGAWMLHGHCHGTLTYRNVRRLDVGVDTEYESWTGMTVKYEPYSYKELFEILGMRGYEPEDRHGREDDRE